MKKTYKIENLDCASCASKIETQIKKIKGVNDASVNFMFQKLTLDANDDNFDDILSQALKVAKKVEPDCHIIV